MVARRARERGPITRDTSESLSASGRRFEAHARRGAANLLQCVLRKRMIWRPISANASLSASGVALLTKTNFPFG